MIECPDFLVTKNQKFDKVCTKHALPNRSYLEQENVQTLTGSHNQRCVYSHGTGQSAYVCT